MEYQAKDSRYRCVRCGKEMDVATECSSCGWKMIKQIGG